MIAPRCISQNMGLLLSTENIVLKRMQVNNKKQNHYLEIQSNRANTETIRILRDHIFYNPEKLEKKKIISPDPRMSLKQFRLEVIARGFTQSESKH